MRTLRVEHELHGSRLLDFLERRWPEADRTWLRQLVASGSVRVNRMPPRPTHRLAAGDVVEVELAAGEGIVARRRTGHEARPGSGSGEAAPIAVLLDRPGLLVVDKPAGVPTVPDRSGRDAGVWGRLQELGPELDLRIVHRLDRDTSGCLLLAKGLEAARRLDLAFREGRVHKTYVALVHGVVGPDVFEVLEPLGPDPRRPGKVAVVGARTRGARRAETVCRVGERFRSHTLLEVEPRTGRSHQIRVHLQHAGHPIVGDGDYGGEAQLLLSQLKGGRHGGYKLRTGVQERPLLARMFLHASRIEVPDPSTGEPVAATAPLPRDLSLALEKVRRFTARSASGAPRREP